MRAHRPAPAWLIGGAATAVAAGYLVFGYLPGRRDTLELRRELSEAQGFVDQIDTLRMAMESTRNEWERAQTYVDECRSASSARGVTELLGEIHLLARSHGTTASRFDPQPTRQYAQIGRIPVLLTCAGTFAQIAAFLQELERLEHTVWIERLRMERSAKNTGDVQCELDLEIFVDNPVNSGQVKQSG